MWGDPDTVPVHGGISMTCSPPVLRTPLSSRGGSEKWNGKAGSTRLAGEAQGRVGGQDGPRPRPRALGTDASSPKPSWRPPPRSAGPIPAALHLATALTEPGWAAGRDPGLEPGSREQTPL